MDARFQGNIDGLLKWEPLSRAGIYLGISPFHSGSLPLVINPANGHVSPQFHVLFDDEISTVTFMREGPVPPNWTDIVQRISYSGSPENIDLGDTCFTPYLD